jgi:hypothetical protein
MWSPYQLAEHTPEGAFQALGHDALRQRQRTQQVESAGRLDEPSSRNRDDLRRKPLIRLGEPSHDRDDVPR